MSRPQIDPGHSPVVIEGNFEGIKNTLLSGVSYDNFNQLVIEGTTAITVDAQKLFSHSMTPQPIGWFPLIGDVYVQEISSKKIDVRSTKSEVNFKIVLLGGQSITNESVRSVGGENYGTTDDHTSDISVNIQDIIDARVNIHPIVIETTTHEQAGDGAVPTKSYVHIVNNTTHFYVTQNGNVDELVRINRSTGVSDTLTCGGAARPLSAMQFEGDYLYVIESADTTGTVKAYKIDLSSFTIDATYSYTSTGNAKDITDIYIDGSTIYFTGRTTGGISSRLYKATLTGGAVTILTLAATNRRAKKIQDDGTNLWVTEYNIGSVASSVYKVSKATFTVSSTINLGNESHRLWNSVLVGGNLWIPAKYASSTSSASQAITYPTALFQIDIATEAVTLHPIINASQGDGNAGGFTQNIVTANGFIYLFASGGDSVKIVEFDTLDFTQRIGWFPFMSFSGDVFFSMNDAMILDAVSGNPIVFNTGSLAPQNFEYFEVDFSNIDGEFFF